jgi:hypothetical protein
VAAPRHRPLGGPVRHRSPLNPPALLHELPPRQEQHHLLNLTEVLIHLQAACVRGCMSGGARRTCDACRGPRAAAAAAKRRAPRTVKRATSSSGLSAPTGPSLSLRSNRVSIFWGGALARLQCVLVPCSLPVTSTAVARLRRREISEKCWPNDHGSTARTCCVAQARRLAVKRNGPHACGHHRVRCASCGRLHAT